MRFMLTLTTDAASEARRPPDPRLAAAIGYLTDEMARSGVLLDTGGLAPTADAVRLSLSGGRIVAADGPFAEGRDIIGGFAIVDVRSKAEAVELARRVLTVHAAILGESCELASDVRQVCSPSVAGEA